jgi:hypothetical protein
MTDTARPMPTAEQLAERLATATAAADTILDGLREQARALLAPVLPRLRAVLAEQAAAHEALLDHVTAQGPEAYPAGARSQTAHGVTYGWKRAADAIACDSQGAAISAADTLFKPADVAAIVRTERTLLLDALRGWTDDDLARIHCRRVAGEDKPYVRQSAGDLEKAVKAISTAAIKHIEKEAA